MSLSDLGSSDSIRALTSEVRGFAEEREWQRFHTARNLCLALTGEVGELASEFQWLTDDEAAKASAEGALRARVENEIADVGIYLLRLCDVLEIDLGTSIRAKLAANDDRYTVALSRGNAVKQRGAAG